MIFELRGVEFVNKGAELMLQAIVQEVRREFPSATFVMEKSDRVPTDKIRANGFFKKFAVRKIGLDLTGVGGLLPSSLLRRFGYVHPNDIDVVLDGSGFAFGDQWGQRYAEQRMGRLIDSWKNKGKRVILLPQAFGPFEDNGLKSVMEEIVSKADIIFAREKQSYKYLTALSNSANIKQAPDFTNLIKGRVPVDFDPTVNQVAIIPNYKMIEKKMGEAVYLNFLKEAVQMVRQHGLLPYFLIHEGKRDIAIAEKVNLLLADPITVVHYEDPLIIKGIISTAKYIICSRFHGVVSALSQGVPCLATSWSHKYEMLAKEYEFEKGILQDLSDFDELKDKIDFLSDPDNRKIVSDKLILNSNIQKQKSTEMWRLVFSTISS
jgi:colanic acid/amylovoran biosynthesis protein